ncbi:MAG: hypothetical protein ACK553_02500 [Planctomycetota bacterium]
MPKITVVFGLLLCVLSVVTLILTGGQINSISIFIPCFVGVPLLLLGLFAVARPAARKHAMHAAAALGLLGGLAALGRGIPQAMKILRGDEVDLLPVSMVWAMVLICITFVFVCVESFVSARKARLSQGNAPQSPEGH